MPEIRSMVPDGKDYTLRLVWDSWRCVYDINTSMRVSLIKISYFGFRSTNNLKLSKKKKVKWKEFIDSLRWAGFAGFLGWHSDVLVIFVRSSLSVWTSSDDSSGCALEIWSLSNNWPHRAWEDNRSLDWDLFSAPSDSITDAIALLSNVLALFGIIENRWSVNHFSSFSVSST